MRRSRILAFVIVTVAFAAAAACGLQDGGVVLPESGDGSTTIDGAPADGQTGDGTFVDGSPAGDGAPTDGASGPDGIAVVDAGKPYFCGPTAVASCIDDCPGFPQVCGTLCFAGCGACPGNNFQCDGCFSDGGSSISVCEPQDAATFALCLNNQTRCPCTDQNSCPGANQTCNGNMCFECGELDAGNSGNTCKSGAGGHMCKTDPVHYGECF